MLNDYFAAMINNAQRFLFALEKDSPADVCRTVKLSFPFTKSHFCPLIATALLVAGMVGLATYFNAIIFALVKAYKYILARIRLPR